MTGTELKDIQTRDEGNKVPSRGQVWRMFDRISHRYDLINRLLSLWQDVRWRNKLAVHLPSFQSLRVLDLATGTGDVLLSLFRKSSAMNEGIGIDMAKQMLEIGRNKVQGKNLESQIRLFPGDAVHLPFKSAEFDAATISFGIRNVQDVRKTLREMHRILRSGGRVLILEFSLPQNAFFKRVYLLYFRNILPALGGLLSGDRAAYRYLNKTVETFPYGQEFAGYLEAAGFKNVQAVPLTFGIATIYRGDKLE